jgi:ABC-type antimicrobial peptide transport system permease subunit
VLTWVNPWTVLVPAIASVLTVVLAVELVLALVKSAVSADSPGGGDV